MAILFDAEKKIFKLDTASSSYVFAVHDSGRLLHLYYGAYLPDCDMRYLLDRGYFGSFTPDAAGYVGTEFSPDTQPSEYSCNGTGDFRISALQIRNADGNIATDIRYVSHRILSEKPALPGMPSLRDENGDSETLEVTALDQTTNAEVKLYYTVYKDLPVMTRHAVVTNTSDRAMELERVFSACPTSTRWIMTWCTLRQGQRSAPLQSARFATAFNPSRASAAPPHTTTTRSSH